MNFLTALPESEAPVQLLPDLTTFLGKLEVIVRIAVMIGPLVLLGMGLLYFLAPPKEANYKLGYRFYWGMSSVESWHFTQRIAGMVWSVLGLGLCIAMAIVSRNFRGLTSDAMIWKGVSYLLWQLGLTVVSILGINLTVVICFNRKGIRRDFRRKPKDEAPQPPELPAEDEAAQLP